MRLFRFLADALGAFRRRGPEVRAVLSWSLASCSRPADADAKWEQDQD